MCRAFAEITGKDTKPDGGPRFFKMTIFESHRRSKPFPASGRAGMLIRSEEQVNLNGKLEL